MIKKNLNRIRDKVFNGIHSNYLIYNTCWEDPRIDRQLMDFDENSEIVMISSAGCNALDYLLEQPKAIHAVDVNPRQNALVALKKSLFERGTYADLCSLFMDGYSKNAAQLYQLKLRPALPDYAQSFWDKKIKYFTDDNKKKTFYYHGTSGMFAWLFRKYLKQHKKTKALVEELFRAQTLEKQQEIYVPLEPRIINKFLSWVINRHLTMTLLGVPRPQQLLIRDRYPGGMAGYMADNFRNIFTQLPIQENYFYHVYLHGFYKPECCPNYLKSEHFDFYRQNVKKLNLYNTTFSQFLKDNPGQYSHFVLLDHQDWLASFSTELLEEEWSLILQNSKPGTRILMRSAAVEVDFIPDFVKEKVEFEKVKTGVLHKQDRVGTYGSVQLLIVK